MPATSLPRLLTLMCSEYTAAREEVPSRHSARYVERSAERPNAIKPVSDCAFGPHQRAVGQPGRAWIVASVRKNVDQQDWLREPQPVVPVDIDALCAAAHQILVPHRAETAGELVDLNRPGWQRVAQRDDASVGDPDRCRRSERARHSYHKANLSLCGRN